MNRRYASFAIGKAHAIKALYPVTLDFTCAASFSRPILRAS
jgi:hypothetical protein